MRFEDLRLEYLGARSDDELPIDDLSRHYRRFYFMRRSLVTLDECCGALNRLNEVPEWKSFIASHADGQRRKIWIEAVAFFNAKKARIASIRGDIGGHFPEKAAEWAVRHLHPETTWGA